MMYHGERSEYSEFGGAEGIGSITAEFSRHTFVPHSHDSYALGVVEAGGARTQFGGRVHIAPAGTVMCINPREVHTGEPLSPSAGWRYRMLYPSCVLVQRLAAAYQLPLSRPIRFRGPVIDDHVLALALINLSTGIGEHETEAHVNAALHAAFQRLFSHHRLLPGAVTAVTAESPVVQAAKTYLTLHLRERVSLADLAAHVALSPYYLSRLFSAATGMAPYTWLEHARVRRAAELLRTEISIAEAAFQTGFSDQAHLTRRFKRVFGVPPGVYARAVRGSSAIPNLGTAP